MTNIWPGVDVSSLCDQHLLGLHKEIHQEAGTIENHPHGTAIAVGHFKLGQFDSLVLGKRHAEVVDEMEWRGMTHDSPLDWSDSVGMSLELQPFPFKAVSKISLSDRCEDCKV